MNDSGSREKRADRWKLPLSRFIPFLSIRLSLSHALPRTDIPAAYFENDWTRFVSRHVPVYFSLFFLSSLESRQFRQQQQQQQRLAQYSPLSPSHLAATLSPRTPVPPCLCHPSFSLLAPTFSFDTGARATTHRVGGVRVFYPAPHQFPTLVHLLSFATGILFSLPLSLSLFQPGYTAHMCGRG